MNEPKKILRQADPRMLVQLSVQELRAIVGEVVDRKPKLFWFTVPSGNCPLVYLCNDPKQKKDAKHTQYDQREI